MSIYSNLEAVHLLDDGSGSSATDSSGNGRTGTLTGSPTWTTGGLTFVRTSSQYVNTSWAGLSGTGAKSVGTRFKTSDSTNSINLWGWGTTTVAGSTIALSIEAGTIYVRCNSCNGSYGSSVSDGNTHRIVVIVPASATMSQVQVWVDGTQRTGTFTNGSTSLNTDTGAGTFQIGRFWLGSNYFDGTIYENYVWSKALDSNDRTLFFAGNYPWYQITPTDVATGLTNGRIFQYSAIDAGRSITFSGTYEALEDPTDIEVKIVRDGTSTTVQDWTSLSELTATGGSYSGTLIVPPDNYFYNFLARIKDGDSNVLATSSQTSNYWGVGVLIGMTGQSNMSKMFSVSSSPPVSNSLTRMVTHPGLWSTVTGNGAIAFANALQGVIGWPVGLLNSAVDDTGLVYNAGSGVWQEGSSPYDNFISLIGTVGGDIAAVIQHQGEADMKGLTSKSAYKAELDTELAGISAEVTRTGMLFGVAVTGTFSHASATDASAQAIREAQIEWVAETGGSAFLAGSSVDMVRTDTAHWTAPYYERMGYRYAQALLYKMELVPSWGLGPEVSTAKLAGNIVKITLNMNGNSDLTELDGTLDGGSLTGWVVSEDNFSTSLTISSTAFVGNEIWLTLSTTPASPVKLRYLYGKTPTITNTVHGDNIPEGDTIGGSLLPAAIDVTTVGSGGSSVKFGTFYRPKVV